MFASATPTFSARSTSTYPTPASRPLVLARSESTDTTRGSRANTFIAWVITLLALCSARASSCGSARGVVAYGLVAGRRPARADHGAQPADLAGAVAARDHLVPHAPGLAEDPLPQGRSGLPCPERRPEACELGLAGGAPALLRLELLRGQRVGHLHLVRDHEAGEPPEPLAGVTDDDRRPPVTGPALESVERFDDRRVLVPVDVDDPPAERLERPRRGCCMGNDELPRVVQLALVVVDDRAEVVQALDTPPYITASHGRPSCSSPSPSRQ